MYLAFIENYRYLINKAWEVTQNYIGMEGIQSDQSKTEDEKNDIKLKYEKDQVSLELVCEAATNLLWYFIPDDYTEEE